MGPLFDQVSGGDLVTEIEALVREKMVGFHFRHLKANMQLLHAFQHVISISHLAQLPTR